MSPKFIYFFILGRNPTLSIAEIASQVNIGQNANIRGLSNDVLILETKEKLDAPSWQKRLGGTIKIGTILTKVDVDLEQIDSNIFLKEFARNKKIFFGFSLYRFNNKFKIEKLKPKIKSLALKIKYELRKRGISSRWVISREMFLSSVIVQKNKLLNAGAEFIFLFSEKEIWLGKTLTCQEFEEYEFYDFGRPKRKIEKGMMPPKLAKIMINVAQVPENGTILDPFCGSGTVIQEAARLGYQHIIGTDINREAIENTQKNIEWLLKNPQSRILNPKQIQNSKIKIFQTDVRNLSQKILPNSINAVVTEPYLGPLRVRNSKIEIRNIIDELIILYLTAFGEFKKLLKKDGRVVIVFPVFKYHAPNRRESRYSYLSERILNEIRKIGFEVINPIPEDLRKNPVIKLTDRGSIIYSRPNQNVLREIFIFTCKQHSLYA